MKILFITPFLPYPPVSGGRLQTYLRMEHSRKRGHSVFLMTLGLPSDSGNVLALKKVFDGVECIYARPDIAKIKEVFRKSLLYEIFTLDRRFGEELKLFAHNKGIDIAVFEGLGVAQYRDFIPRIPSVLYEHNVEHEITGQLASYLRKSPLKIFGSRPDETMRNLYLYLFGGKERRLVRSLEIESIKKFDLTMTCSDRDADILKKDVPDASCVTIPWAVRKPEKYWLPGDREVRNLVFVGSMAWEPNRDAVLWFAKEIFPMVRKCPVRTKLLIAGSGMVKEIAGLDNQEDIIVKGFVPDISETLLEADVFIAPVRFGSGVNVKVLEAMAYGLPVITTPKGAEGIKAKDLVHFMVAETREEFALAVQHLLQNPEAGRTMGMNAKEYIATHHDIERVIGSVEEALFNVVKAGSPPGAARRR